MSSLPSAYLSAARAATAATQGHAGQAGAGKHGRCHGAAAVCNTQSEATRLDLNQNAVCNSNQKPLDCAKEPSPASYLLDHLGADWSRLVQFLLDLLIATHIQTQTIIIMAAKCIAPSSMLARTTQRSFLGSKLSAPSNGIRVAAKLGNWLPGSETPAYLENAVGSYGFDPLSLAKEPAALQRYTEAELIHGRWAMAGVAGCLAVELLGQGSWFDAPLWVRCDSMITR